MRSMSTNSKPNLEEFTKPDIILMIKKDYIIGFNAKTNEGATWLLKNSFRILFAHIDSVSFPGLWVETLESEEE